MKNTYKQGVTLLEIMIVLAIVVILIAVVVPQFSRMRENQVIKNAVADVVSTLSRARSSTLASIDSSEYGVHFQSDQVIIFKGTAYSPGDTDNEIINITSPASISNVTLGGVSATSGDVYFSRLSGAPSDTGTVTISSTNFSKIITISATGTASSN
jgi:prepilin-type N-terminal cleavage/methylation domain-containing protein